MEKPGLKIKVGLLVGGGILLLMITIIMLGGDRAIFQPRYDLKARFESVPGLASGSVVHLVGIKVGSVSSVDIDPETNKVVVTMEIFRDFQDRITEGSLGELRTQGALGDKYIFITPGHPDAKPIPDGGWLDANPHDDLFTAISKKGGELKKVFEIINNLDKLVRNLNAEGRSGMVVNNLAIATGELSILLKKLNKMTGEVKQKDEAGLRQAVVRLNSILKKIDNGTGTLGKLVNDPSLHSRLKEILGGSKRSKYLKGLIRQSIQTEEKKK